MRDSLGQGIPGAIIARGAVRIWKLLDRLQLSGRALELQHQVMVQHLVRDPSNHSPLLLSVVTRLDNKPMPVDVLNVWTTHHNVLGGIKDCWFQSMSGSPLHILPRR